MVIWHSLAGDFFLWWNPIPVSATGESLPAAYGRDPHGETEVLYSRTVSFKTLLCYQIFNY